MFMHTRVLTNFSSIFTFSVYIIKLFFIW